MFTSVIVFIKNLFDFGKSVDPLDIKECDANWNYLSRRYFDKSRSEIVTLSTACEIPEGFGLIDVSSDNKLTWTVETNGFHTAVNMKFQLDDRWNPKQCRWSLYIPETSFLDIGSAKDRELPSPHSPKLHFAPMTMTFFEIQHRYQPIGESGNISILPPIVFCSENGEIEKIEMERPQPIVTSIPVYSGSHKNVISVITKLLPIIAVLVHIYFMMK